jgi:hypothetical protein
MTQRRPGKKRTIAKATIDTSVSIYNISSLLAVSKDLALKYTYVSLI